MCVSAVVPANVRAFVVIDAGHPLLTLSIQTRVRQNVLLRPIDVASIGSRFRVKRIVVCRFVYQLGIPVHTTMPMVVSWNDVVVTANALYLESRCYYPELFHLVLSLSYSYSVYRWYNYALVKTCLYESIIQNGFAAVDISMCAYAFLLKVFFREYACERERIYFYFY